MTPKNKPCCHVYNVCNVRYHVKFGSFASEGICTNRREPQNWGALGHRPVAVEAWSTPEKYIPPHILCYAAEFGHSLSNCTSVIKEIYQKNLTPRIPPFKVIGTDTDRSATYDFVLNVP